MSNFYILRLEICGVKNIETPIELEFYKKTIRHDFDPDKYKIKAVYGENGSGKTAIITAVKMLKGFLLDSHYLLDGDNQKKLREIINKKKRCGYVDVEFYSDMNEESINRYRISFELRDDERVYITDELLERKELSSSARFNRVFKTSEGVLDYYQREQDEKLMREKTMNLLDKQSLMMCAWSNETLMRNIILVNDGLLKELLFFAFSLSISIDEEDGHSRYLLREMLSDIGVDDIKKRGVKWIKGIKNSFWYFKEESRRVSKETLPLFEKKVKRLINFIKIFKPELSDILIERKAIEDDVFLCTLKMVYPEYQLDEEFESRGIKKMIELFDYLDAACNGSIVFIDELDASINDVYLDKIIEYFMYYGRGQLCFTAHNLSPMELLRRNKKSIDFISSINTVHTWTNTGNASPERTYKNGFIEDSPFNVEPSDFLGVLGR